MWCFETQKNNDMPPIIWTKLLGACLLSAEQL